MDGKQNKNKSKRPMYKVVKTLNYKGTADSELFGMVNEYARELKGISPKAAIRNLLLRILPSEIKRLRDNSGDFLGRQSA